MHEHVDKYIPLRLEYPRLGGSHYCEICVCGAYRRIQYRQPVTAWVRACHEKEN